MYKIFNNVCHFFTFVFVFLSLAILGNRVALAADQTVSCISNGCSIYGGPLFKEVNIAPGDLVNRTLHISNTDNVDSCDLNINVSRPQILGGNSSSDFASRLFVVIESDGSSIYGAEDVMGRVASLKTLYDLSLDSPVFLGNISAGDSKDYIWTVYFDDSSDNKYQSTNAKFDINLSVSCGNQSVFNTAQGAVAGVAASAVESSKKIVSRVSKVLGSSDKILDEGQNEEKVGEVKSTSCLEDNYLWWLPLVVQFFLSVFALVFFEKINFRMDAIKIITIVFLALISQFIHQKLGCNCATSIWCSKYWLFSLLVILVSFFAWKLILSRLLANKRS